MLLPAETLKTHAQQGHCLSPFPPFFSLRKRLPSLHTTQKATKFLPAAAPSFQPEQQEGEKGWPQERSLGCHVGYRSGGGSPGWPQQPHRP